MRRVRRGSTQGRTLSGRTSMTSRTQGCTRGCSDGAARKVHSIFVEVKMLSVPNLRSDVICTRTLLRGASRLAGFNRARRPSSARISSLISIFVSLRHRSNVCESYMRAKDSNMLVSFTFELCTDPDLDTVPRPINWRGSPNTCLTRSARVDRLMYQVQPHATLATDFVFEGFPNAITAFMSMVTAVFLSVRLHGGGDHRDGRPVSHSWHRNSA